MTTNDMSLEDDGDTSQRDGWAPYHASRERLADALATLVQEQADACHNLALEYDPDDDRHVPPNGETDGRKAHNLRQKRDALERIVDAIQARESLPKRDRRRVLEAFHAREGYAPGVTYARVNFRSEDEVETALDRMARGT